METPENALDIELEIIALGDKNSEPEGVQDVWDDEDWFEDDEEGEGSNY